jgi:hypothetical protein
MSAEKPKPSIFRIKSISIFIFILITLSLASTTIKGPDSSAIDIIRRIYFKAATKEDYKQTLKKESKTESIRVFESGGWYSNPQNILYDARDEIKLPPEKRSIEWWDTVGRKSEFGVCEYTIKNLDDHFYLIMFAC